MYLRTGKCNHCGRSLDDTAGAASHNYDFRTSYFYVHSEIKPPLFCSKDCVDKALRPLLPSSYGEGPYLGGIVGKYKHQLIGDDFTRHNIEIKDRALAEIQELRKLKRDKDYDLLQAARAKYIDDYIKEMEKIESAKKEEAEAKAQDEAAQKARITYAETLAYLEKIKSRPIPDHHRFEHTHILGPSGSGKTTLLQHLILKHPRDAYLILDPKGTDLFEPLAKIPELISRIILIDPFDKPALPLFSARNPTEAVSNFSYVFSTARQNLTGQQETCFSFCVSLLFHIPNATLITLLDLLDDNEKQRDQRFVEAAKHTDHFTQRFFDRDYFSATFKSTKEQIKARVYSVARDQYLRVMFDAPNKPFDMFTALQQGKIVLVNTRMNALGDQHQTLGRFLISQFFDAIMARSSIPKAQWNPAFLICDEAQEFIDAEKAPRMLRLMRSFNGGAVLAHHNMYNDVFDDGIRAAISTNTGIKFCSDPRGMDINYMARDMRCEPEFLTTSARKIKTHARFACLFSELDHPFLYDVPLGHIDTVPKVSEEVYLNFRAANRRSLAATERSVEVAPAVQRVEIELPPTRTATVATPRQNTAPPPKSSDDDHSAPVTGWGEES